MTRLFGGDLRPLGSSVQFVEAAESEVVAAYHLIFGACDCTPVGCSFVDALTVFTPLQAPWTRLVTAQIGPWTALTNNARNGGDTTAPGPAIRSALDTRCVVATHLPRFGPGHAQTQLEVLAPDGVPPLKFLRSISASATDGRWSWYEFGDPLPFEETDRYEARLKRDRFDRPMLLRYLQHLGIDVSALETAPATVHQRKNIGRTVDLTPEQVRQDFGW